MTEFGASRRVGPVSSCVRRAGGSFMERPLLGGAIQVVSHQPSVIQYSSRTTRYWLTHYWLLTTWILDPERERSTREQANPAHTATDWPS